MAKKKEEQKKDTLVEAAKAAITAVFSDTSVDKAATLQRLRELEDHIDPYTTALKTDLAGEDEELDEAEDYDWEEVDDDDEFGGDDDWDDVDDEEDD